MSKDDLLEILNIARIMTEQEFDFAYDGTEISKDDFKFLLKAFCDHVTTMAFKERYDPYIKEILKV